jgi:methionyl-tRNA formyltransferase
LEEQDVSNATYYPQRKPDDGLVDWSWNARFIFNWIRAQTHPYPGAFTFYDERKLYLWRAEHIDVNCSDKIPGEVIEIINGSGIDVCVGDGALRLIRVQSENFPPEWADHFAHRNEIRSGTVLGTDNAFPDWIYTGIRDEEGRFDYETNLRKGDVGRIQAVCCSQKSPRNIQIITSLNNTNIHEEQLHVDGWNRTTISFSVDSVGPHNLKVEFYEDEERIDMRYLKLYGK